MKKFILIFLTLLLSFALFVPGITAQFAFTLADSYEAAVGSFALFSNFIASLDLDTSSVSTFQTGITATASIDGIAGLQGDLFGAKIDFGEVVIDSENSWLAAKATLPPGLPVAPFRNIREIAVTCQSDLTIQKLNLQALNFSPLTEADLTAPAPKDPSITVANDVYKKATQSPFDFDIAASALNDYNISLQAVDDALGLIQEKINTCRNQVFELYKEGLTFECGERLDFIRNLFLTGINPIQRKESAALTPSALAHLTNLERARNRAVESTCAGIGAPIAIDAILNFDDVIETFGSDLETANPTIYEARFVPIKPIKFEVVGTKLGAEFETAVRSSDGADLLTLSSLQSHYATSNNALSFWNASFEYEFDFSEAGNYRVFVETSNTSDLKGLTSAADSAESLKCSDPGIQHHINVYLDGVKKGEFCSPAATGHQIGYVDLGTVSAGLHRVRIEWDNDWVLYDKADPKIKIGDSNIKIYTAGIEKQK